MRCWPDDARMAERLRISRDLHDVLGHNLTSLTVHLDVADRLAQGASVEHVRCARTIAGTLLDEVRGVVSQIRVQPVDLRATLLSLTEGLPGLRVDLTLPDELTALDPARADAILRCVQELITNTLRHAQAHELSIEIRQSADGALSIAARDDGRGGEVVEGHGLSGMRERFEALGGSLSIACAPGRGFSVQGQIPALGSRCVIRVCLADDQALFRSGVRALLALFEGIAVVAEADQGEAAVAKVLECRPDVLLLDVRMPRLNGVEVLSALARESALPPTLLLTTFEDDAALIGGIRAGARGFLLKGTTPETLVEAIRTVAAGGTFLHAALTPSGQGADLHGDWRLPPLSAADPLTAREREVLSLMTNGLANTQIAAALRLGEGTVRNHVSNILAKLGVSDRTKAVLVALRQRLV